MPHKFNTSRRHKFAKKKYRVTNWCGYNESLRNRGDLTVWITGDARKHWAAPRRRSRGGQPRYSDLAITMCLTLGMVYRLPLRQTQGLIRSISKLMLLEISVPDFSTLSRRGRGLSLPARPKIKITDPVHLAIDSTGLKVFDEGEWLQSKYNVKAKRKRWRKLHLGLNLVTGDIVCSDLTLDDVGDPTVLPDLLNQIGTPVSRFIADGAYDGAPTSDLLKARFGEAVENTDGALEGYYRAKTESPLFRKSANGGQNRRRHSQQNDRTRPTRVQTNLIACITGKGGLRLLSDPCNNAGSHHHMKDAA